MCAIYVELLCAIRFGLDWTHDIFLAYMSHVHAFSSIRTLISLYSYILMCLVLFYVSLFLPLSFFQLVASWYLNENPLHSSTLVILGHLFLLTLHLLMYSFVMIKLERNFRRTFVEEAFIWNAKSSYRIRGWGSFTVGVGGHYVTSRSLVPPWSYKSFTPICTRSILLYLISSLAFEVRA